MPKNQPVASGAEAPMEEISTPFGVVFPVAGLFLAGIPHVPMIAPDAIAARLVSTGAFTFLAPELPKPDPETGITEAQPVDVVAFPDEALAALDFYAPVVAEPAPVEPTPDPEA